MNHYSFSPAILNKLTASVNQQYRKFNRIDPTIDKIDLQQEALIWAYLEGLYYTEKDFQFPWFSLRNHLHEYFQSLQKQQGRYLPRRSLSNKIQRFIRTFRQQHFRTPTFNEIQDYFALSSPHLKKALLRLQASQIPQSISHDHSFSPLLQKDYDYLQPIFYHNFQQFLKSFLTQNDLLILNAKYQLFPDLPVLSPSMISRNYKQQHTRILRQIRRKIKQEDWKN